MNDLSAAAIHAPEGAKRNNGRTSLISLLICCLFIGLIHFLYYPKWDKPHTEATISYDVSGYYWYLPAFFIYNDARQSAFMEDILDKYRPSSAMNQVFLHESGNYVAKYSAGQAVQFLPFFLIADAWATNSDKYPADGYSFPYQFMISMGSLAVAFIGLIFLRFNLLNYFHDRVTAVMLLALVFGTNYLNYSAIDGAMTHNNLFTIYCLLIYVTISFYKHPGLWKSAAIGLLVGLAALTRPTEIICVLIPVLWGIPIFNKHALRERLTLLYEKRYRLMIAIFICIAVGFIQPLYWKYSTGEWIVYSYQDQGFSWLSPHIFDGLFSYKSGWLTYTPLMIFSLIGFAPLRRQHRSIFSVCLVFTLLFIYIAFAWDIWWYGGSLGQRTMVQAYAVLAFPFSAFIAWTASQNTTMKSIIGFFALIFTAMNLWFTHQAHRGGLLYVGQMTKAYYWETIGTFQPDREDLKLLDKHQKYRGVRRDVETIYTNELSEWEQSCDFEWQGAALRGVCLNAETQYGPPISIPLKTDKEWLRAKATFYTPQKEWDLWKMAQLIVRFKSGEEVLKTAYIRVHRLIDGGQSSSLFVDSKIPKDDVRSIEILFWNSDGNKPVYIRDLEIQIFDVK